RFGATSNVDGQYLLAGLPPGTYKVTASMSGFKLALADNVPVHVNERLRQDFTLQLGDEKETVIVQAVSGPMQTESAEIKDVIQNQQVMDLPLKDREFLQLTLLSEGVVNPPGGTRGDSLQQTGTLINVLGQRTGHNLFLVDGVSVTDEYYNNVALNPAPDDTREFNIAKTNYDAEFGGKSGGVINVITQSGTDVFHGSAYEFLRNNVLDARNYFDGGGPAPAFHENQFGGSVGGPIRREKTFFFLNYDGQRIRQSVADVFSVPTQAQRQGIFSTTILNPATGQPFPGNSINAPLDLAASALLVRIPLPNLQGTANNLRAVEQQRIDSDQVNVRLDHRFSNGDDAWLRGPMFYANEFDPFGSSVLNEALLP